MASGIYVIGGYQTDFSANWARSGREIADGIREVLESEGFAFEEREGHVRAVLPIS